MIKEFEHIGKAMGTDYSIAIVGNSEQEAKEMYNVASKTIEDYEAKFSRFIPTSELSVLNEKKDMIVSPEFLEVTLQSYKLFTLTHGIFNPLVQVARFGYNKTFDELKNNPSVDNSAKADEQYDIDFSTTTIDEQSSRITLRVGQKLDFGGFLKGYLAEKIAKRLMLDYPRTTGVVINLGGDIHTRGLDENGNKFVFHIYNPVLDNEEIAITLYNQSLATSGTYKRKWMHNGLEVNHVLDPSGNENPITNIVSASVIHQSGSAAEGYAKVFLSLGSINTLKVLGQKEISYVTINNHGEIIKNIL